MRRPRATVFRTSAFVILFAMAVAGCESSADRVPFDDGEPRRIRTIGRTPDALMVRFRDVRGTGSSRETWEVEVLQLGSDVRVRGSIRTGGTSIPILHVMDPEEYLEFWHWLEQFPVDRAQFVQDETQPEEGWRKSFDVDVVVDSETRLVSRNRWTRPLVDAAWVDDVEARFHAMALDMAHSELDRMENEIPEESADATPYPTEDPLDLLGDEAAGDPAGGTP